MSLVAGGTTLALLSNLDRFKDTTDDWDECAAVLPVEDWDSTCAIYLKPNRAMLIGSAAAIGLGAFMMYSARRSNITIQRTRGGVKVLKKFSF